MRQFFALFIGAVLLVVGAMFSLLIFAALAVFSAGFFFWFWWKTRALRKVLREQQSQHPPANDDRTNYREGAVFDGEAVVVDEETAPNRRLASADLATRPDTPMPLD